MPRPRIILHIDMNSFFASAEQQANPFLRGKAMVVSGKPGTRSVIVAASREAKKFGIKTTMLPSDAIKLCPQLIFVEPDGDKYAFLHHQLVEVLKNYTDALEVFSIDEGFLDLTGHVKDFQEAEAVSRRIKLDIRNNLGECMTCSIGIAENKLLAKLASDMMKPDGLVIITPENKIAILDNTKLTDLCGIGHAIEKRLNAIGINSMKQLRDELLSVLINEFGEVCGRRLADMSRGIDHAPVVSYLEETEAKSVGRSYTMPADTWDKDEIFNVLMRLCEKVGRALRQENLAGRTLVYYLRYRDFTHAVMRRTLKEFTNDGSRLFEVGASLIAQFKLEKSVRQVGVHVSNLSNDNRQLPLFSEDRKRLALIPFIDKINDAYGELTIKPAFLLKKRKLTRHVGGFKNDLI